MIPTGPGAERLHARLPESELAIFEESGHFPFVEKTGRFLKIVGGWLERMPAEEAEASA